VGIVHVERQPMSSDSSTIAGLFQWAQSSRII
jgi:hypothetical protein